VVTVAASAGSSCPPFSRKFHVRQQWLSRQNGNDAALPGGQLDRTIKRAWDEGVPVGLKNRQGTFRLYPPEDVILVKSDGLLRTVIPREGESLHTKHLQTCDHCEQHLDPKREYDECPWCGAPDPL
jgi:hypothetical protein